MGAIVTIKYKYGEMNYEFDIANDGVDFKKDIEKEIKKNGNKTKITIKKSKDIPLPKPKRRYYDDTEL